MSNTPQYQNGQVVGCLVRRNDKDVNDAVILSQEQRDGGPLAGPVLWDTLAEYGEEGGKMRWEIMYCKRPDSGWEAPKIGAGDRGKKCLYWDSKTNAWVDGALFLGQMDGRPVAHTLYPAARPIKSDEGSSSWEIVVFPGRNLIIDGRKAC